MLSPLNNSSNNINSSSYSCLGLLGSSDFELLATLEGKLHLKLALLALQTQGNLLCCLGLYNHTID